MSTIPPATPPAHQPRGRLVQAIASLVVAGAAVTPLIAPSSAPVALLVAALVIGATIVLRPPSGPAWLGSSPIPRGLLIAGACLLFTAGAFGLSGLLGAVGAAAVLIAALVAEVFLRASAGFQPPIAAGLGLHIAFPRPGPPAWLAVAASLTATIGGIVIGALGAPGMWWLLVSLAASIPLARIAAETRGNLAAAQVIRQRLPKAVARYAPTFVVWTAPASDPSAAPAAALATWLPLLRKVGEPFVVLTHGPAAADAVAADAGVAVVEVRTATDLAALDLATLRATLTLDGSSLRLLGAGLADFDSAESGESIAEAAQLGAEEATAAAVAAIRAIIAVDEVTEVPPDEAADAE